MKESTLTEVYKSCHVTLEKNLVLNHISTHHTEPDMTHTYSKLHRQMNKTHPYRANPGRRSHYIIPYVIDSGAKALMKRKTAYRSADGDEDVELRAELEDLNIELGM